MSRTRWALVAVGILSAVAVLVVVAATGDDAPVARASESVTTQPVQRGTLSSLVSAHGILTHRARADGSAYAVVDQAAGTYTALPEVGVQVGCGDVLYRVDDRPVLLLCGPVPAYRDLHRGDVGSDVRQLNRNLHGLGSDAVIGVEPEDDVFTAATERALQVLQHDVGLDATGTLGRDEAVFLPEPVRIASVTAQVGGPAQPGATVATATSSTLEVHFDLDPSRQGVLAVGDVARITLPGSASTTGKVARVGNVVAGPSGPNGEPGDPIIPVTVNLDDPSKARGSEEVPVQVDITTTGVEDALSVPVVALVGRSGGGMAVEVVRPGGRRELVPVRVGLFDSTAGRVQVDGALHEGDRVVVPSL